MSISVEPAVVTIDGTQYKAEPVTIESTFLGREDHGIPTFSVQLKGGGWGIGMSGYRLGEASAALLIEILDVVGVESWEKLKGTSTHALMRDERLAGLYNPLKGAAVVFAEFMASRTRD